MQSMDRIHRLGMAKDTQVVYHLLIGKGTIDEKIDERLWQKFKEMSDALNDSWPRVLDYDGTRDEISKEESQKDFNSLVDHLKEQKKRESQEKLYSDEEWENEFKPKIEKLLNDRDDFPTNVIVVFNWVLEPNNVFTVVALKLICDPITVEETFVPKVVVEVVFCVVAAVD